MTSTASVTSAAERAAGHREGWEMVDEGWGRRAVDFATLSEPGNCREYVAIHHRLGISEGDRLLDVACGAGLATTSFRGIWGTTPAAVGEIYRVLVPGGQVGLTVRGLAGYLARKPQPRRTASQ